MSNDLLRPDSYFLFENNRIQDISELTEKKLVAFFYLQDEKSSGDSNV